MSTPQGGSGDSGQPSFSADGRWVFFVSSAQLVDGGWRWRIVAEGDPPHPVLARSFEPMINRSAQVYLRDIRAATTTWISSHQPNVPEAQNGADLPFTRPALSPDGKVAFYGMDDRVLVLPVPPK